MSRRTAMFTAAGVLAASIAAAVPAPTAAAATTSVSTQYLLNHLSVATEHATGYARAKFTLWVDADHDGCDTRHEVLIAEAVTKPAVRSGCTLTGGRWVSKYDGVSTTDPSTFDIDHLVPLAEAWQSGAWRWDANTRMRYANDLGYAADLIAVTAHANRSKGDREPQSWLPPRASFDCTYMAWWVAVKWRWQLRVNAAEKSFLTARLSTCGWPRVRKPGRPVLHLASSSGGTTGGTGATGGVTIHAVYFDSPGSDDGSNASRDAEWVQLNNPTSSGKAIGGWTLRDASSHVFVFPSYTLAAGHSVKVHTGTGTDTSTDLYWGSGSYIWNNTGDTATLTNSSGGTVDTCSYTSSSDPEAFC